MTNQELQEINKIDPKYRPLSAWAYFGYSILFALPLIGIISIICCALSSSNINRRSFARSYFCIYIVVIVIVALAIISGIGHILAGVVAGAVDVAILL